MMPAGEMDNGVNGSERNLMCEVFQTNLYSMSVSELGPLQTGLNIM